MAWLLYFHINTLFINLIPVEFKGNLYVAVTLFITVTRPFSKGGRYIQVWLYSDEMPKRDRLIFRHEAVIRGKWTQTYNFACF